MSISQTKAAKEGEDRDHHVITTKYNLVLFEQASGQEWEEKENSDVQNEV